MPMYVDAIITRNNEHEKVEPITVTITLEEYRSLIGENARLNYEIQRLYEDLNLMKQQLKEREG